MTAKKERGVTQSLPRTQPLANGTIAYAVLNHLRKFGDAKPADLYQYMPGRRQNTATVFAYVERLEKLGYAKTNHMDVISITLAGIVFIDNKQEEPTPKYKGKPAAPRVVIVWTPPMHGYEASMRANWRTE